MARIFGVNIPDNERLEYALTILYGIGYARSKKVIKEAQLDKNQRIGKLKEEEIKRLVDIIDKQYKIEGELREEEVESIKRLRDIVSYRGSRHAKGLPARGQRTRSNSRTKKGKRKTVGALTKEAWAKIEQQQQQGQVKK